SYGDLCALITRGRRAAEKGSYRLTRADMEDSTPGCVAILIPPAEPDTNLPSPPGSGARERVGDNGSMGSLLEQACWLRDRFRGRAWIAAELLCGPDDRTRLARLREFAAAARLPLVASGDVHMHVRSRRALQDTLTAIGLGLPLTGAGNALFPNGERHLRSRERLARTYPPELLAATVEIAGRCGFDLGSLRYEYPEEIVPPGETPAGWLRRLTEEGFRWRFGASPSVASPGNGGQRGNSDVIKARHLVEHELRLIAELGYEPYFLTVHDIVKFARSRGILCQGRGSAANSAVCYCLGITEVDPSRMEMLFERFISRERNEPPDIDVDFEHQRREEVIQYIYEKYGRERAALAATVITYRPRSAIRDVGKALGLSLAQVDALAKTMAWWDGRSVVPDRLREAGLDPGSPVARRLTALVAEIQGFPRHLSQHVGGFVIARGLLSRLVPVENAAMEDRTLIQWDKDDLDTLGLLKVDVLALGMLSCIRRALALVSKWRGRELAMSDVPAEDPAVYEMVGRGDTVGVFQIESRAQMAMLPRLQPRCFYDLVIEVAIVRPGPIQGGMVHPYLRRRQKLEPVTYPSEAVKQVLERTLGVPIFQEQVMSLAVVAAGFTPGEADQLRRSMAAWRRKGGLWHFQERLATGMKARGYTEEFANRIFKQILGFGEYGFPESHAASFALLVYVSAWLKCHHPAAFAAALLNSQPMGFYSPSQILQDARRHGVAILPADAAASKWDCTLEKSERGMVTGESPSPFTLHASPALRLGLRMVRGLSQEGGERIIALRRRSAFASVEDLARRAKLSRHDLQCLAGAGALASLAGHRRLAAWEVAGVEAPPPLLEGAPISEPQPALPAPTEGENLVDDYRNLGFTLGRHPLALLRPRLARMRCVSAEQLRRLPHGSRARAAGLVTGRQRPDTASGVVFVTLEDETGMVNVIVWRDLVENQRRELLGSSLMGVSGVIERQGEVVHLVARRLADHSRLLGRLTARSRDFH
ncbi:MAG TPA: error-prone DNA polymerase, partial [Burkholderiales bacterium]|nr:error-prone DNA polymerase [Burkholderiales bacterium]